MKTVFLAVILITLLSFTACSSAPAPTTTVPNLESPTFTPTTPAPKKITLDDAPDILNISLLLPSRFEQIDSASEGISNKDLGLGSDVSEVQLYMSEDPFQMIYGFMAVTASQIDVAIFDRQIEDDDQMEIAIRDALMAGASEAGGEATIPNLNITHPEVGDSAILGEGDIESFGFYFGFDMIFFRSNKVYVFLYSLSYSTDKVPLLSIAEEIEKRIGSFSQ